MLGLSMLATGAMAAVEASDYCVRHLKVPSLTMALQPKPKARLTVQTLSPELRRRGYGECNPYDFVGLGPYAPYRKLRVGRIAIPQRGGHTDNYGYDVVVHFHGQTALRMTLAQVARGVAFVGIDLGIGSGAYSDAFLGPDSWPLLRASIDSALRAQSGDSRAHVRHVALTAWSAGYGAVNEILKYHADSIDAVVLLDGLHAAWDPRTGRGRGRATDVVAGPVAPTFDFARRALAGDKLFVFTYSDVDPVTYPSTSLTAARLLSDLGLPAPVRASSGESFGETDAVDVRGLHVWGFRGDDKPAHCTHLAHIDRAVRDILEPAWDTPEMDRDVPFTPAPKLGPAAGAGGASAAAAPAVEDVGEARGSSKTDSDSATVVADPSSPVSG